MSDNVFGISGSLKFVLSSFESIRKTAESNPHYSSSFFAPFQTRFSVQLVPITTKVVSSNPVHGEVYSIQHYVIKFFSDLRSFSPGTPVSSNNKTVFHNITEILLKVTLNTINHKPQTS